MGLVRRDDPMEAAISIEGDESRLGAVLALADLMQRLRMESAFVGEVARAGWLGEPLAASGPVDMLALVQPDRAQQIPMMAANRGFRVEKEELQRTEELDLLPMWWEGARTPVRVHVLFASNALYSHMIRDAVPATAGGAPLRIVAAEDLALLMLVGDAEGAGAGIAHLRLRAGERFDRDRLNGQLASIGLGGRALA